MGWKWVQQDWAHKTLPVVALLQIISVKRLQDVICTGEADKIWEHPNLILAPLYIHWEYSLKSSSDYTTLPCLNLFKAFSTFGIKSPNFILASMSLESTGLQVWPPFPLPVHTCFQFFQYIMIFPQSLSYLHFSFCLEHSSLPPPPTNF